MGRSDGRRLITLGLNGWIDRTHDSAAALLVDGDLVAFVEQERLSRRKHGIGEAPHAAVQAVLRIAGVESTEVDLIAYGWDLELFNRVRRRTLPLDVNDAVQALCGFPASAHQKVEFVDHHLAHAASAFYGSGLDQAAVLVVDAEGETGATSIYVGSTGQLKRVVHFDRSTSLGFLFRGASVYCGFGQFGAGQVMGLAPYAPPSGDRALGWDGERIVSPLSAKIDEDELVAAWGDWLAARFGPAVNNEPHAPWQTKRPDAARLAQDTVEALMVDLVDHAITVTGQRRVCLAGGVALNCVANGLISRRVDELYIPPVPHDAGVALGAACVAATRAGDRVAPVRRADLGPEFSDVAIEDAAKSAGVVYRTVDDPKDAACDLLEARRVIGWFQGRMEAGPRALGRRSILALPDSDALRDRTNDVKERQRWRPLAPAVRTSDVDRFFEQPAASPFMLLSLTGTPEARKRLPGGLHVDGTARLQTVEPDGTAYQRLLDELDRRTGAGVVLNTSFNGAGEPIVCTPADAISTFMSSGLDALVIGSFVIERGRCRGDR